MKPLELTMAAFGSYAAETTIPFEQLAHGLYLVTGDTGAGKTTLFDAIMFALYGRASGADRDNNLEMLHSDYVPLSEDTRVSLRFLHDGREYTVRRSIHFPKKRTGPRAYGDPAVEAELLQPDDAPINRAKDVTARIEALLGLNAEQFRKIVMLAQGEFQVFLKARSEEKAGILKKLFDSSAYSWYQNLICGARDALEKQRRQRKDALDALMKLSFRAPEGLEGEQALLYLPDHPRLLDNLEALIRREAADLAALEAEQGRVQGRIDALNARRGAAQALNDLLAELAAAREHLAALEALQPEMDRRASAMNLAERALHRVKPSMDACARAEAELADTHRRIAALQAQIKDQSETLEAAKAGAAGDDGLRAEAEALAAGLRRIDDQLPLYAELDDMLARRDAAQAAVNGANEAVGTAGSGLKTVQEDLRAARALLETLSDVDARALVAKHDDDHARQRLEALAGEKGIRHEAQRLQGKARQLAEARRALVDATREALAVKDRYDDLYARFIAGQAGLLAETLRRQLREGDEARCPVCHTRLCREHLPRLAALSADTPDSDAVDAARAKAEAQERRRADRHAAVEKTAAALLSDQNALVERARQWLPDCDDWTALCAPGCLEGAVSAAEADVARSADRLKALLRDQNRRDGERARLPQLEARQQALEAAVKQGEAAAAAGTAEVAALEAAIAERRSRLDYPDKAEVGAVRQTLASRQQAIADALRAHREALEGARQALDVSNGSLSTLLAADQAQAAALERAHQSMADALAREGFADGEAVLVALAPMGDGDGEAWLRAEQQARHDYDSDRRNTRARIDQLQAQTGDRPAVDMAALQSALGEAEALRDAAAGDCGRQRALLDNHRGVHREARAALDELGTTESAWRRIDRLAGLALGLSGEDGKRSFERYVLGAVFTDILEMANRRLDGMSGGRYELVLRAGATRANAKAGLDVDVLDYSTQQQRPSGSLSGGEAFFTSLALALGLSDVVQSHAGGRRLDALFIDEGFGTLSDDYLDKALEVLNQLTEGDRLVGIISHVDKLSESIPQKIRVHTGPRGSWVEPIA